MPNWTFNELRVTDGTWTKEDKLEKSSDIEAREQLKAFKKSSIVKVKDDDGKETDELRLTFQGVKPRHEDLDITSGTQTDLEKAQAEINKKKYGHEDWYSWNCANWGTKWDACHCSIDPDTDYGELEAHFDTAWSPPIEWLEAATKKYPLLHFSMRVTEESNAFIGNPTAFGGEVCLNLVDVRYPDAYGK